MISSMTGFGNKEKEVPAAGKFSVEIKSANHKFLDMVLHLPEGFLQWEDKIKKEIESKIKRGRITCVINISTKDATKVFINKELLKEYLGAVNKIKKQYNFNISDEMDINTLINLPGVLSLAENKITASSIWPKAKVLINQAIDDLVVTRNREGRALYVYLNRRVKNLDKLLGKIIFRFKKAVKDRVAGFSTNEERAAFLKDSDITEEIERLSFHIRTFKAKLPKAGPVGKELDFIAQEMQREANTMGAKSFDVAISGSVLQVKSQVEKMREQVQNVE
ncbi:MAG: YicC/YloC family endoribonuclease [Candidatus Omnitrophota bacterium]|nr:YicC family protein [Candidatus Omnitrophota bacterium]MBU1928989.1 YicC family protein [Candidatus Omnitrophota bacterium]MBU2035696.1 YicC family protein [Candidatus Omnitrophota bacterium]MBU2222296.1 YicC family protein [Candidatus Omnitrophota bacterium]MBU2258735.1 YicC family protein [Candidatus Omnitrophota bacterium]